MIGNEILVRYDLSRESSEHAEEHIREKGERVTTPASGNVFGSERFDGQPDDGDPVSPNPTLHALHATSSPPTLRLAASAPRSVKGSEAAAVGLRLASRNYGLPTEMNTRWAVLLL